MSNPLRLVQLPMHVQRPKARLRAKTSHWTLPLKAMETELLKMPALVQDQ